MTQFISPNRFPKNAGYSVQDRFGLKNDDYEGFISSDDERPDI